MSDIDKLVADLVETVQYQDENGDVVIDTGYVPDAEDDEEELEYSVPVDNTQSDEENDRVPWVAPLGD